jgi:Tol biopolymer transport system component
MERGGNLEIYTVVAERADPVNLTNNLATDGTHSWLRDGARIALASDRDGGLEIYVLHLDTGAVDRLTNSSAVSIGPILLRRHAGPPIRRRRDAQGSASSLGRAWV